MPRTFYDMLMVTPEADADLITVVYRHLAKRYHPDAPGGGDEGRMMELNEAYAILGDDSKRARYDEIIGSTPPASDTGLEPAPATEGRYGEAGVPPSTPAAAGSVLTFGRYRGWALNQVLRYDRDYLEWLDRTTTGRNYRAELADLLRRR